MKFIKSVPMAICGLALAFAALGNLLRPYGETLHDFCGVLLIIILLLFALKLIFDFPQVREELKTPVPLSALPTSTMALMLLCTYLQPYLGLIAISIWYAAVIAHLSIVILFIKRFISGFKLDTVFPTWFVAFVGIVTVSVTAPIMNAIIIGQTAFYIGFILYFVTLALVAYRMMKVKIFPEPARPTIAILTAPMSLCVVGYFSSFQEQNSIFVYVMLAIAAISYIYVSIKMVSLLKIKFYPTYASFTFPYVISATAFRLGAVFLAGHGLHFFVVVADITMWIAILIVIYVSAHYINFFRQRVSFLSRHSESS